MRGPFNGINAFVIQELPTHASHVRPGIVLHQEEPREHCTNVRFDNCSEDCILVPNSRQGTIGYDRGLCDTPRICLPRPSLTHRRTAHAGWCHKQHNVHHGVSRLFHVCHMCSVWTCSSDKSMWRQWRMPIELHGARLWAQVPREAVGPSCHSRMLFLTIVWQCQKHAHQ